MNSIIHALDLELFNLTFSTISISIPQLTITLKKEDTDEEKSQYNEYCYAGGLVEYVKWLNADKVCFL